PSAYGTVKVAATKDGQLRAYEVDCHGSPGVGGGATVNFNLLPYVYLNIPKLNIKRKHTVVRLNVQTARAMRAPGHPQNCILTDQAIDDLCARLNQNPLDFRIRNLPPNQGNDQISYGGLRHTIYAREIEIARKNSNWDKRWHPPGQGGNGPIKQGMGMA